MMVVLTRKKIICLFVILAAYAFLVCLQTVRWTNDNDCALVDSVALQQIAMDLNMFFRKEGILAHPWVLTMVGAVRYGGNSIIVDGAEHIGDHDIDLRIVLTEDVQLVLQRLNVFLHAAGHWTIFLPNGIKGVHSRPFLVFIGGYTALGWKQATEIVPMQLSVAAEKRVSRWCPPLGPASRHLSWLLAKVVCTLLAPLWSLVTIVDFHVDIMSRQPDPDKTILWCGQNWSFPLHGERVFRKYFTSYLDGLWFNDHKAQSRIQGWCDLYLPRKRWKEDLESSQAADDASRSCADKLMRSGYFSFADHCSRSAIAPHELDSWI